MEASMVTKWALSPSSDSRVNQTTLNNSVREPRGGFPEEIAFELSL